MTRKLSEEETLKFVQLYREQECLWDNRCDAYKNKQMRISALQQICEGMAIPGLNIGEIKAKIKSIRSTYYLELNKIEKSTKPGAGGNTYTPRVKWFDELNSFIKTVAVRRGQKRDEDMFDRPLNEVKKPHIKEEVNSDDEFTEFDNMFLSNEYTPEFTLTCSSSSQEKSTNGEYGGDDGTPTSTQLEQVTHFKDECAPLNTELMKESTNYNDEYEAVGINVAAKLRKMDQKQAILAEYLINHVLYKGLLSKLSEDSKLE